MKDKEAIFSDRINDVPRSFIREILKVAIDPDIISFAGGLPNRKFFPTKELEEATSKVFQKSGKDSLQYGCSEGHPELREYIAKRYLEVKGIHVSPENILITNGSQQGLDLLGKTLLNEGDALFIEEPGYLGAIQAFSLFRPRFISIPLNEGGVDLVVFKMLFKKPYPKFMYGVPNFQNPSGISYTDDNRKSLAHLLKGNKTLFIEDDPYGELRFAGERKTSFYELIPENTILLGSFSKVIIPGFRIGWLVAPNHILEKLITAKQASDLHTSHFTQNIIYQFLKDNNVDKHIEKIRNAYGKQCKAMVTSIEKYFPSNIKFTRPEGGMFLWVDLPEKLKALDLFELAVKENVVFVPGEPFYVNKKGKSSLRLNFSSVDVETIEEGIKRLGRALHMVLG